MCDFSVSDAKAILPWVALDAVTIEGTTSSVVDLGGVSNEFTLNVVATGNETVAFTKLDVRLEGSLDGEDWYSLLGTSSSIFAAKQNLTTEDESRTKRPHARYVRVRLAELAGGTSPTVSAQVAVGKIR